MGLIPNDQMMRLRDELATALENPVKLVILTQQLECKYCAETRQLAEELATLSDKIKVETYDLVKDSDKAELTGVDRVPAVAIMGEKDYGVRFYGFPFGYEFQTLLGAIVAVSKRRSGLSETTKAKLREITVPVHIQVFVTLTCPHCSTAANLAYSFAMENDLIKADVVDISEFPQFAVKYEVMGVPKIVVNEKVRFVGSVTEDIFLQQVLSAIR